MNIHMNKIPNIHLQCTYMYIHMYIEFACMFPKVIRDLTEYFERVSTETEEQF
jgi:hypothetical protein